MPSTSSQIPLTVRSRTSFFNESTLFVSISALASFASNPRVILFQNSLFSQRGLKVFSTPFKASNSPAQPSSRSTLTSAWLQKTIACNRTLFGFKCLSAFFFWMPLSRLVARVSVAFMSCSNFRFGAAMTPVDYDRTVLHDLHFLECWLFKPRQKLLSFHDFASSSLSALGLIVVCMSEVVSFSRQSDSSLFLQVNISHDGLSA